MDRETKRLIINFLKERLTSCIENMKEGTQPQIQPPWSDVKVGSIKYIATDENTNYEKFDVTFNLSFIPFILPIYFLKEEVKTFKEREMFGRNFNLSQFQEGYLMKLKDLGEIVLNEI